MLTYETTKRFLLAVALAAAAVAAENYTETTAVAVQGGSVTFAVNTNIPALSVKGKTTSLHAQVQIRRSADGLQLEKIDARIPVKTLVTGMALRDEHMRKYIFTTASGETPDLQFTAENVSCPGSGSEIACPVSGNLSIRGVARPFTLPLKVHKDGEAFKASGDTAVKLSAYGIEQPSQFGVKTEDEVHLHVEFTSRPGGDLSSAAGVRR